MRENLWRAAFALLLFGQNLSAQRPALWHDPSPHSLRFVAVEEDVKLEVLDWGGSGRPVILLAGLGNTAHVFDEFAPKLTPEYHVYGITRRGYGASSIPTTGYSADRLGDDVVAVLDALKLEHPVLVGHSIAGEELSSIGTRHPERIAGLIYLDAGYPYAFYDPAKGDYEVDSDDLQRKLAEMLKGPAERKQLTQGLLETDLPRFERDLREIATYDDPPPPEPPSTADRASFAAYASWIARVQGVRLPEADFRQRFESNPDGSIGKSRTPSSVPLAIISGEQKFTDIRVSVLAIYAAPHAQPPYLKDNSAALAIAEASDAAWVAYAKTFETAVPSAHVVRFAHAHHYVFLSNEADVLREVRAFLAGVH